MKLFYVDPALFRMGGHPYNMARAFRRELIRRGVEVEVFCNERADAELVSRLEGKPAFSFRPRDTFSRDPVTQPLEDLLIKGDRLAKQLRALEGRGVGPSDVVYFPLAYDAEIFGCANWLAGLPRERHPRLFLYLMNDRLPVDPQPSQPSLVTILYRFAANQLRARAGEGRVLLGSSLETAAAKLRALTPLPCRVWPLPQPDPTDFAETRDAEPPAGRPPTVAVLGNSAPFKGFHYLPRILPQVVDAVRPARFFIQILPFDSTGRVAITTALEQALHAVRADALSRWKEFSRSEFFARHVDFHVGEMPEEEYFARVRQADIHLLAYNPAHYLNRTSGIFVEAAKAGRVAVAPANTWMGEQIRSGKAAGTTFEVWRPDAIAAALRQAIDNLGPLSAEAVRLAPEWRTRYSISALLDEVLAWNAEPAGGV